MAERARRGDDPSDADADVALAMAAVADPWPTATDLDTSARPADVIDAALAAVDPAARGAPR